jgi:predicted aspartyl protease
VRNGGQFSAPRVIFAGDVSGSGWIDLPRAGGFIMLQGAVAGAPIRVLVDSGAQSSAIDAGFASRLGLAAGLPLPVLAYGVGGGPSVTHTVGLDLDLGALRIERIRAAVLNLAAISAFTNQPFDMLLGRDVLRSVILEVDYPRRRAAFLRHEAYAPPKNSVLAPVTRKSGGLHLEVSVESGAPISALVDTGASGALALSDQAAAAAGLLDQARKQTSGRSGGASVDRMVTAHQVRFAGFTLRDVKVSIFAAQAGSPLPDGLIGAGLLKGFRVGLDHRAGALHLSEAGTAG